MNRGEIYLAPFPYSDLQGMKRRPVCVVSPAEFNAVSDPILVMVTSSRIHLEKPTLGDVVLQNWQTAGLLRPSVLRAGRLLALEARLLVGPRGGRSGADLARTDDALRAVLGLRE